jgi:hypothetical protein
MKPTDLNLSITPELSKLGRPYRQLMNPKNLQVASKWINKVEYWHWYYFFVYTDDLSLFGFEFDYNDNFIQKFNDEETRKIIDNL